MIFRVQKTENYVVLDKGYINDRDLSLQAKGLLTIMLALPNDWQFYEVDLIKRSTNGRDAVRAVIKELQNAGYIVKEQGRKAGGKFSRPDFVVHERPIKPNDPRPGNPATDKPATGKPATDKPATDKPATENPTLLSNNVLNNNLLSNKDTKEYKDNVADAPPAPKAEAPDLPFKDVVEYLNLVAGTAYRPSAAKNKGPVVARLNEGFAVEDLKKVVDIKVKDWARDSKMQKFIRPETLFGPKCEGYLNEWRLKYGVNKGRTEKQSNVPGDVGF